MKPSIIAILCMTLGSGIAGCTTVEQTSTNNAQASHPGNRAERVANPANTTASANSVSSEVNKIAVAAEDPIGNVRKSKMEARLKEAENSPPRKFDMEAELKKSTRPAPENSEFGVVLTDVVFERRTFRSHPQLLKVEKTTEGEKKTIKVYLRDGRIIEIDGAKIEFLSTASSVAILRAAAPAIQQVPESRIPKR